METDRQRQYERSCVIKLVSAHSANFIILTLCSLVIRYFGETDWARSSPAAPGANVRSLDAPLVTPLYRIVRELGGAAVSKQFSQHSGCRPSAHGG